MGNPVLLQIDDIINKINIMLKTDFQRKRTIFNSFIQKSTSNVAEKEAEENKEEEKNLKQLKHPHTLRYSLTGLTIGQYIFCVGQLTFVVFRKRGGEGKEKVEERRKFK